MNYQEDIDRLRLECDAIDRDVIAKQAGLPANRLRELLNQSEAAKKPYKSKISRLKTAMRKAEKR